MEKECPQKKNCAHNLTIFVLAVLCGVLAYMQFGMDKQTMPTVEEGKTAAIKGKLPPSELIKKAQIHGISLETPIEDVDGLLEQANYKCNKTDNRSSTPDTSSHVVSWYCTHNVMKANRFSVSANGEKIQNMGRAGPAYEKDMDDLLDHLDNLRTSMNSREGLNVSQSGKNVTFQVRQKKEGGGITFFKYHLNYLPNPNPEKPQEHGGVITASITR